MPKERAILNQIKTQLADIDATGSYTHDLSGTDQIKIGGKFSPDRLPAAYLWSISTTTSQTPGRTLLSKYSRTMTAQIEMWVGCNSADSEDIHLATLDAQNDVMLALEADRTLAGAIDDLEVNGTTYDGEAFDSPGLGVAVLQLRMLYSETAGS